MAKATPAAASASIQTPPVRAQRASAQAPRVAKARPVVSDITTAADCHRCGVSATSAPARSEIQVASRPPGLPRSSSRASATVVMGTLAAAATLTAWPASEPAPVANDRPATRIG